MSDEGKYSPAQAEVLRIGTTKIAYWTGRSESAVYKWLTRRPSDAPVPPEHLPAVIRGAKADGVEVNLAVLWPDSAAFAQGLAA